MNTPLPTENLENKGFIKSRLGRIIMLVVGLALVLGLTFYARQNRTESAAGSPEKSASDLAGTQKTSFDLGEDGYLNLRVYADSIEGFYNKADVILILDVSSSMGTGSGSKLEQAKTALKAFVDDVNITRGVNVGLVKYFASGTLVSPLVSVDSDQTKIDLKNLIDGMTGGVGTCIGCGVEKANTELINNGRSDAEKRTVLFTDGMENTAPFVNGIIFNDTSASAVVNSGSPLDTSIKNSIQYYSIHYGDATAGCTLAMGCSLMRFTATKTNSLTLSPAGTTYASNYGSVTNVDRKYLYKTADATELENIYKAILNEIESASGVPVRVSEKLAGELSFVNLVSVIDKGGRSYTATVTDGSGGEKILQLDGLPENYDCNPGETACQSAASGGKIDHNYTDFKIQFKANRKGTFDADSNYEGCDTGKMNQIASDSKVEYLNPSDGSVYKTMNFSYLCLAITDSLAAENVMKVTFGDTGRALRKATFEAGETVYVSLIIQETETSRTDFAIFDTVPKSIAGTVNFTLERAGSVVANCSTTASGGEIKLDGGAACQGGTTLDLKQGINTIKYEYKI